MQGTLAAKLMQDHLVEGDLEPGEEIGLRIDQTLTQDATGTLVMLELEAMDLDHVKTEKSVQYVDHNLLQTDSKNPDDHLFLESACRRFGVHYSPPGNGVSHPVHMETFGVPGKFLLGSDSHTCAAGSLGMLAMGTGGLDVALAMAGEPYYVTCPEVMGVRLEGELPDWVSAKDVILEMLRRHDVDGGFGKVLEYHGPGLQHLSAMDRHVIANMGQELGATASVFPSDEATRRFLQREGRGEDWRALDADDDAEHDDEDTIDLAGLEPLIARPSSPGDVVPVADIAGEDVYQCYIGSSANPGYRDIAIAAEIAKGDTVPADVSFDINPTTREILENLAQDGHLVHLLRSGARIHQTGCNGCIGMGQAPASDRNSLRTVPRNFPGRSGTKEDRVFLCSPETAAASAIKGEITDPRTCDKDYPRVVEKTKDWIVDRGTLRKPPLPDGKAIQLVKGPNVRSLPRFGPLPDMLDMKVLLVVGDDVSTDEILPAGTNVLPYRSNIPKIAEWCFAPIDEHFHARAKEHDGDFAVVGGDNYGQGSSREHAVLAPRTLGQRAALAKSFARIHRQNLVNFGVLPLTFTDPADHDAIAPGDRLVIRDLRQGLQKSQTVSVHNKDKGQTYTLRHGLSPRQVQVLLAGGQIVHQKTHRGTKKDQEKRSATA